MKPTVLLLAVSLAIAGLAGAQDGAPPADPRLDTQLTLDLTHVTVGDLCWVIEQRTGVVVTPTDTATGDLLVHAAGAMTARDLLAALAEALLLDRTQKGSPPAYTLRRSAESVRILAAYQAGEQRAILAAIQRDLAAALDPAVERLPAEGDDDAIVLDPLARERLLTAFTQADLVRVLAGETLTRPFTRMAPRVAAEWLHRLRRRGAVLAERQRAAGRPVGILLDDLGEASEWSVRLRRSDSGSEPGSVHIKFDLMRGGQPRFGSAMGCDFADYGLPEGVLPRLPSAAELPPDALPVGAADQSVQGTPDVLVRSIHRALGTPLVMDAYHTSDSAPTLHDWPAMTAGVPLTDYLDRAGRWKTQRWGLVGDVITVQRANWAQLRLTQPPESTRRRWITQILEAGRLHEADALDMAELSWPQVGVLASMSSTVSHFVQENWGFLQLWRQLPERTRSIVKTRGQRLSDLPLALQPLAFQIAEERLGPAPPLARAQTILKTEDIESGWRYVLVAPDGEAKPRPVVLAPPERDVEALRKERERRIAALQRAAGTKETPP